MVCVCAVWALAGGVCGGAAAACRRRQDQRVRRWCVSCRRGAGTAESAAARGWRLARARGGVSECVRVRRTPLCRATSSFESARGRGWGSCAASRMVAMGGAV